ncbi:hypothetical protein [Nocardia camponoti]|uniref:Uncharacterized protein n=1 Tax=Nocardia camponoti TaxID=1616106 RepID=A0A917VD99_9NOCA|nr:hypothetical protein [Nocardia camponoti]GGK65025.1 hypothetical protein GCM10011591_41610 [Nocardia camponoti]
MPDLLWNEVKNFFDPQIMGALPDLWVPDTTAEDWQTVLDLIQSSGWRWDYREDDTVLPLPRAADVLPRPADAEQSAELYVRPARDVLMIFRLMTATEIDFDVDLRELQGQVGVDTLIDFMCAIGRQLGKPVLMAGEGQYGHPVLGFDPASNRVVLLADPRDPED